MASYKDTVKKQTQSYSPLAIVLGQIIALLIVAGIVGGLVWFNIEVWSAIF